MYLPVVKTDENSDLNAELEDKPTCFKLDPSQFNSDFEYTKEVVRSVRRMHSIDDRLAHARRESISTDFTTRNVWPTALSCPLVQEENELQDHYYVKAMVPVCKTVYEQEFSSANPG